MWDLLPQKEFITLNLILNRKRIMKRLYMTLCGMIIAFALIMTPSVVAGTAEQNGNDHLSVNDRQIHDDDILSVVEVNYLTKEEQYFNLSMDRLKDDNRSFINESNLILRPLTKLLSLTGY